MIEQEPEYGNVRILVAESGAGALPELLAPLDAPVDVVSDPAELLGRIRARRPDLVLVDLDAGVDAVALLRALRRDPAIDNIPVILIGTRELERGAVAALAAGADDFLTQPVSLEVLQERMRYALAVAELIRRVSSVRAEVRAARDAEQGARDEAGTLRAAAQRATELERMKRDFLGLAAHELRAHLALARARLALVGGGAAGDGETGAAVDVAAAVARLESALARMARLVDSMAATAEMEAATPDMGVDVVDLHDLVRCAIDDAATSAPGTAVNLAPVDRPFFVAVAAQQVRDVVASIVENAMICADEGGAVRVSLGMNPSDHAATVAVTGRAAHGHAAERPAVRSEFSRSLSAGESSPPAIAELLGKAVARFHGGELVLSGDGDAETTLTLRIPLAGPRPRTTVLGGEVDLAY
ncbi:MAG: hybrid sensor histidine kinase/response regulator [Candidatus Dormibacteraeota bacterium]|nr:hybrid sensor histidine kinase/response regulator [Candidatus Dormibacteraeota bacterium]MBV9525012.1 hybrid sensor histidine kinase/response regulator [Candidatus Dormibacteraeota bacterium]